MVGIASTNRLEESILIRCNLIALPEMKCMIIVYALYVAFLCFLLLRWFCCTMYSYVCFYFLTVVLCMIIVCAWKLSFEHDHCICKNSTSSVLSVCFVLLRWFCCIMYSYDCFYFLTQESCMIIVYAPYYCKEYYVSYCSGDAVANMFSYDMLLSLD